MRNVKGDIRALRQIIIPWYNSGVNRKIWGGLRILSAGHRAVYETLNNGYVEH